MDFNLTDDENVYMTTLKVPYRQEKDFVQSFFVKSPTVYEDLKRCHLAWFVRKIKTAHTAAKKW